MQSWKNNYRQLQQRGILTTNDYDEMIKRFRTWATHLAIAQEDPYSTTHNKVFDRAQRLHKRVAS